VSYRQVPGPDAAFLYGERPEWHFHVSALMMLDPSTSDRFSFEEVVAQLGRRIHHAPQFRWKLVEGPFHLRLERPIWVDDPNFDVANHVNRVAVPGPGDQMALGELVGQLVSYKIDRTRPLWEMWLIEGLQDGRQAILAKIHHSIIDGSSGSELATLLYDLEADPEPDPSPPLFEPEPVPALLERVGMAALHSATWPIRTARFSRQVVRQGLTMGRHAFGEDPPAQPMQAPRTLLNGKLTPDRKFSSSVVSLADTKLVKNAFGVKLNDVIMAITAGALRLYLIEHTALPDKPLIAQVPVSLRADDDTQAGTKVAALFCSLATDIDDPAERLRRIHASSTKGKAVREELTDQHEVNWTDTLPPAAIALAARSWSAAGLDELTPPVFNLIISNVPGPQIDLFLAGARVDAMYPMGPLLYGSGINVTVVSTTDELHFGLISCPALVPDPWSIADSIPSVLAELVSAAEQL
jgi:diacylglycerol O-acyltransferase / wax synthase